MVIDTKWREHLAAMDHLRQGIHLRGYAQKNPKQEYKREAFQMFQNLWSGIKHEIASRLVSAQVPDSEEAIANSGIPSDLNAHAFQKIGRAHV